MSVRLRNDLTSLFVERNVGIVIEQRGNVLLLDDIHMRLVEAEVVVLLEERDSLVMRVVRDHDAEWNKEGSLLGAAEFFADALFTRLDVLAVVLEVAVVLQEKCNGQLELDAREAKSLAETACNKNDTDIFELVHANGLVVVEVLFTRLEVHSVRNLWRQLAEGIDTFGRVLQELSRTLNVALDTVRRRLVKLDNLLSQLLGRSTAAFQRFDEIVLVARFSDGHRLTHDTTRGTHS